MSQTDQKEEDRGHEMSVQNEEEYHCHDKTTTCNRCQQIFNYGNHRVPKYLSCMHTLCLVCVTELSEGSKDGHINCPICCQLTMIRNNQSIQSFLPTNFLLSQLLSAANVCDNCETDTACLKCLDCDYDCSRLCEVCSVNHKKFKAFREHRLVALACQAADDKGIIDNASKSKSAVKNKETLPLCSKHSTKLLNMYCMSCRRIICLSCAAFGHESHTVLSHEESAIQERESVQEAMNTLYSNMIMYRQTKCEIQQNLSLLADQKQSMLKDTKAAFTVLMDQLKSHQERLSSQVVTRCNRYRASLMKRIDSISSLILACKRFIQTATFHIASPSISCHDILEVKRLLAKAYLDISCAHNSFMALLPLISYSNGTFKEVDQLIPAFITCYCHSSRDVNDPATIHPDKCSFEVMVNGNFTPTLWRVVLLLTLRNYESSALQTDPTGNIFPVLVTAEVIKTDGDICNDDGDNTRTRTGRSPCEAGDSELLNTMTMKQSSPDMKEFHCNGDNSDPTTAPTTTPDVDFSVHVINNGNGTYYISVSSEIEITNLLAALNYGISVSVKVLDTHVQRSPYLARRSN